MSHNFKILRRNMDKVLQPSSQDDKAMSGVETKCATLKKKAPAPPKPPPPSPQSIQSHNDSVCVTSQKKTCDPVLPKRSSSLTMRPAMMMQRLGLARRTHAANTKRISDPIHISDPILISATPNKTQLSNALAILEKEVEANAAIVAAEAEKVEEEEKAAKVAKAEEAAKVAKAEEAAKVAKAEEAAKVAKAEEAAKVAKAANVVAEYKIVEEAENMIVEEDEIAEKIIKEAEAIEAAIAAKDANIAKAAKAAKAVQATKASETVIAKPARLEETYYCKYNRSLGCDVMKNNPDSIRDHEYYDKDKHIMLAADMGVSHMLMINTLTRAFLEDVSLRERMEGHRWVIEDFYGKVINKKRSFESPKYQMGKCGSKIYAQLTMYPYGLDNSISSDYAEIAVTYSGRGVSGNSTAEIPSIIVKVRDQRSYGLLSIMGELTLPLRSNSMHSMTLAPLSPRTYQTRTYEHKFRLPFGNNQFIEKVHILENVIEVVLYFPALK